jgi:hypothetical protein
MVVGLLPAASEDDVDRAKRAVTDLVLRGLREA